jgi:hypothetical protein
MAQEAIDYATWNEDVANLTSTPYTLNSTVNVCVCYYTGLAQCQNGTLPSQWSGYEYDLAVAAFKMVSDTGDTAMDFNKINWLCGWPCTYWDLMYTQLATNGSYGTRTCDISLGGNDQTSKRIAEGVVFSVATLKGGDKILIYVPNTSKLWVFLRPFSPQLWLLMFATCVFVAVIVWLFEIKPDQYKRHKLIFTKAQRLLFATTGLMLQGIKDMTIHTTGSRVFVLGYCFLVLVLMNTYIAVLSSQLTSSALKYQINGVNDIVQLNVGIYEGDTTTLSRYQLHSQVPLPWNNRDDELKIINDLRSGVVDALLMDGAFSDYYSTMFCDVYEVGASVRPFDFSLSMATDTPQSRIDAINHALITLKEQGLYDSFHDQYLGSGLEAQTTCPGKSFASLNLSQLKLTDMAGLWVFFGTALIGGLLLNLALWMVKRIHKVRRLANGLSSRRGTPVNDSMASAGSIGSIARSSIGSFGIFAEDKEEVTVADAGSVNEMLQIMERKINAVTKDMHGCNAELQDALEELHDTIKCAKADAAEEIPLSPIPRSAPSEGIGKFFPMPPDSSQRTFSRTLSKSYVTFDNPQCPSSLSRGLTLTATNKVIPSAVPLQDDPLDQV